MSKRLEAFRLKAVLRFKRGYMLPAWTQAEIDAIMKKARELAEWLSTG